MSKQFNTRLPELTHEQIDTLSQAHGLTKTQVIILAVDRFVRALESRSEEADRDIRRLKTVARIAPHLDLGQDD
jgi:predicted DNA-binding protein